MYNLFSRSISKSKYPIKSLSNICNKISSPKSGNSKKKSISDISMRKGTSNDHCKPNYQILKRASFCVYPKEVIQVMMFSTSSSKYFYTTTINQNRAKSGKSANTKAIDVYKKALEEVMKRKFQKKPIGRLFNQVDYKNKTLESSEEKVFGLCKKDIASKEMGRFDTDLNKIKVIYANYRDTTGIMDIFPAMNRGQIAAEREEKERVEKNEKAGSSSLKFPNLLYTQRSKKSSKIIGLLKNNKIERHFSPMLRYRESMERLGLKNTFLESQKRGMSLNASNNEVDRETEMNSTELRGVSEKSDLYNDIIKTAQETENDRQLEDYKIANAESRIFTMPVKNIKTEIEEGKRDLKPESAHLEDLFNYMKKLDHLQEQILSSSDTRTLLKLKKSEQKDELQKSDLVNGSVGFRKVGVTPAIKNSKKGNNILEPTQKPLRISNNFSSKRIATGIIKKDAPSSDTYKVYKFVNKSKSTKPTKATNRISVPKVQQNITFKSKIRNFISIVKKYLQNINQFKSNSKQFLKSKVEKPTENNEAANSDKKEAKNVSTSAKVQPKNDSEAQRENRPLKFPAIDKKPLIEQMKDSLKTSIETDFKETFGDSFKDKSLSKKKTDLEQSRKSDTNIKKLGDLPKKENSIKELLRSNDVQTPKNKSELDNSKRMDSFKKASKIIAAEEKEIIGKHSSWLLSKQNYSKEVSKNCCVLSKDKGTAPRTLTSQIKNVGDGNKKAEKNVENVSPRKMFRISKLTAMSQVETKTDDIPKVDILEIFIPKEESTSTIEKSNRLDICLFSDEQFRLKMLNDIINESEKLSKENLKSIGKFVKPNKEEMAKLNLSNVQTFEDIKSSSENEGLDQISEDKEMQIWNDSFEQPSITPPSVPPHVPPSRKDDKKKKLPPPSPNKGMILPPRNGTVNAKLKSKESQETKSKDDDLSASKDSKESPKGTEPEKNSLQDISKLNSEAKTLEDNESLQNKLGFIEELEIKYKDGSDPNLIRRSKEMDEKGETTPNKCHAKSDEVSTGSSKNPTSQLSNDLEEPHISVTQRPKENQERNYPKSSLMYFYLLEEDGMPETVTVTQKTQLTENDPESNLKVPQLKENYVKSDLMHFYLLDEDDRLNDIEATKSHSKNDTTLAQTETTELAKQLKEIKLIEEDLLKKDRITKVCSSEKELSTTKDDAMGLKNENKKNIKPTYPTRTFMSMLENRLSKPDTTKEDSNFNVKETPLHELSLEEIDTLIKNSKVVEPIKDSTSLFLDISETTPVNKTLKKNHSNEKLQKDPMLLGNPFGKLWISGYSKWPNCLDLATMKNLQFVSNIHKIDKMAPCDNGFKIISDDQTQKQEITKSNLTETHNKENIKRSQLTEPQKSNAKSDEKRILNPTLASDEDKDPTKIIKDKDKDKDKEKAKSAKKKELTSDKKASDKEEPAVNLKITLTRKKRKKAPITVTEDPNKRPIVIVTYSKKKEASEKKEAKEANHKKVAYKVKNKPVTRRVRKVGNREAKGKKKKKRRDIILFLLKEEIKRNEEWHNQLNKKNISPTNKVDKAVNKYKFKIPTEVSNDFNSLSSADLEMNEKKRIKEKLVDKFHRNLHKKLFNSTKIKPAIKSDNIKQMPSKETGSTKSKPVLADNISSGQNYETKSNFKKTSKPDSAPKETDKNDGSDLKPKSMLDGSSFVKTTKKYFQEDFAPVKNFYTTRCYSESETLLTEDLLRKLKGETKRNYCKIAAKSCSNREETELNSSLSSIIPSFRTLLGRKEKSPTELKNENKYQQTVNDDVKKITGKPSKILKLILDLVVLKKTARAKNKISVSQSENSIEDITNKPLIPSEELTRTKSEKNLLPKFQSERDIPIRIVSSERLKNEVDRFSAYTLKYVSKNLNDTNNIFTREVKDSNLDKDSNNKTGGEKQDTDSGMSLEQRDNRIIAEILKNWMKQHMKTETSGTNKDAEKEK